MWHSLDQNQNQVTRLDQSLRVSHCLRVNLSLDQKLGFGINLNQSQCLRTYQCHGLNPGVGLGSDLSRLSAYDEDNMNQAIMGDFLGAVSKARTRSGTRNGSRSRSGTQLRTGSWSHSETQTYGTSVSGTKSQRIGLSYSRSENGTRCRSMANTRNDEGKIV